LLAKAVIAEVLHIQPSEVDGMTREEMHGYIAYIEEVSRMRQSEMRR